MNVNDIEELQAAILRLHGCKSTWVESVRVKETFRGETVWDGVVQVFDLVGHSTANRCYAWSHGFDDSQKRKFYAVLHQGPVDSPRNAIRAAIIGEAKSHGKL
jgi:hypothetical protein